MFDNVLLACWNCKENMKSRCLKCAKSVCNRSSSCHVVASEDEQGWKAGHRVAFCVLCCERSRETSEIATEAIQSTSPSSNSSYVEQSKSNSCSSPRNRTCLPWKGDMKYYSLQTKILQGATKSWLKSLVLAKPKYKPS